MELYCALAILTIILILVYINDQGSSQTPYSQMGDSSGFTTLGSKNRKVITTSRDDLTSWALHKHPEDIDIIDYSSLSVLDADIIIHREGGVNKMVKGPDRGRLLTDKEVENISTRIFLDKY